MQRGFDAQVAQSVEQGTENPRVGGSIPPLGTEFQAFSVYESPFRPPFRPNPLCLCTPAMQSAKWAERRALDFLGRQAAVDALHHARVPVPHGRSHNLRRYPRETHPLGVGAAQIVRGTGLDAGLGAGQVQVPTNVRPGREELFVTDCSQ